MNTDKLIEMLKTSKFNLDIIQTDPQRDVEGDYFAEHWVIISNIDDNNPQHTIPTDRLVHDFNQFKGQGTVVQRHTDDNGFTSMTDSSIHTYSIAFTHELHNSSKSDLEETLKPIAKTLAPDYNLYGYAWNIEDIGNEPHYFIFAYYDYDNDKLFLIRLDNRFTQLFINAVAKQLTHADEYFAQTIARQHAEQEQRVIDEFNKLSDNDKAQAIQLIIK